MTPAQLRVIFRRNFGASAALARDMGIHKTTLSAWFMGRLQSARVQSAVLKRALELLDKERDAVQDSVDSSRGIGK